MRVLVSFCCCDKHWPKATWGRKGFIWLTVVVQQWNLGQELKAGSKAETKEEGAYWHIPLHLFILLAHRNQDHHTWRSSTHSELGLPTWTNNHENNQRFAHRPIRWRHSPVEISSFQVTNSQELPSAVVPWFPALLSTDPLQILMLLQQKTTDSSYHDDSIFVPTIPSHLQNHEGCMDKQVFFQSAETHDLSFTFWGWLFSNKISEV